MRNLLTMVCFAAMLVGCSSAARPENAAQADGPQGNPVIDNAAQPPAVEATMPSVPSGSAPRGIIKVKPPRNPVASTPAAAVRAGWQTYTSAPLKIILDYPSGWDVAELADGVTFTSSEGDRIKLQALQTGNASTRTSRANEQCNNLINSYGLTAETCFDESTLNYSVVFNPDSNIGLAQPVMLSTTGQSGIEVYKGMLDSLHPVQ